MPTKKKILILDDYPELLDALKIFLEGQLYQVRTVTSKELLAAELKRFKPHLIILDVFINGIAHGREICKIIKSDIETKHIPVLLMSVSSKGLENFKECEADAIIEKPFDLSYFLQQIKTLVNAFTEKRITKRKNKRFQLG
ncbi:MAG: response regulator [Chitinophagaceae bacterium]|nr:response regulator [Chitinophagaceae bacterium]